MEDKVLELTPKQKAFCDYYIELKNGTQAAIKAGYSENTAGVIAYENLKKPHLYNYIKQRNDELNHIRIADMNEVKRFWTDLLRDPNTEHKDRLKASEFISKTNGAFLDKVEHTGNMSVTNPAAGLTTEELKAAIDKL